MSKNFALIKNGIVENIIVADNDFINSIKSNYEHIEETTEEKIIHLEDTWNLLDGYRRKKPYESWAWNQGKNNWEAPTNYPEDDKSYVWDEKNKIWIEVNM